MNDTPEIAAARIDVERRRAELMARAQQLQHRLAPGTLAKNTWAGAKEKGADLAEDAVDAVRARPIAAGGAVAALTMFLAREPLMDLAGRLWGKSKKRGRKPAAKGERDQPKDKVESE